MEDALSPPIEAAAQAGSVYVPATPHPAGGSSPGWVGECGFATEGRASCANSPPKATDAVASWDNATNDREIVLFGGTGASGSAQNETYVWSLGNWTKIEADGQTAAVGPARTTNSSFTYDGTDGYSLLYGGWTGTTVASQAYSFHAGAWTKQTVPGALGGRSGSCLVWIPPISSKGNYVLLFGGAHSAAMGTSTWKYAGGTFTNITSTVTGGPPPGMNNPMCAWNPVAGVVDLFGGWLGSHNVGNELWTFNPASGTAGAWSLAIANATAGSPPARQLGSLFYDSSTGKMVLAGGGTGSQLKAPSQLAGGFDTWTLVGTTWTNVTSLVHIPGAYLGGVWGMASTYAGSFDYGWTYGGTNSASSTSILTAEWTVRPTASLGIQPISPVVGTPLYLNVTASGGDGIYHFNWTGLPAGCSPANATRISCTPTIGGTYNVSVNVTDSASSPWPGSSNLLNATIVLALTPPPSIVGGNLTLGGTIGAHSRTVFFGTVGAPTPPSNWNGGAYPAGALFNSSPLNYSRTFGGGQGFDPTANVLWVPPGSGSGTYVNTGALQLSESAFKAYYSSLPVSQRQFLAYLPAQANSTNFAEYTAQWFHQTYGLSPIAWEFGNEPNAWTHYGINWSAWSTADAVSVTPAAYATMVRNYATGVHSLFPSDQFIGIESASAFGVPATFISTLVASDYSQLNGIAYHEYPAPNATNPYGAIGAYYSSLTAGRGITAAMAQVRGLLTSNCGGNAQCLALPVQVGEYNGGPSGNFSVYDGLYQGAVYLAASVTLALKANVSAFQVFSIGSLLQNGILKPEGLLYQRILENLTMGTVTSVNVTGPSAGGGLFAIETSSGVHRSLLIVNTNLTHAVNVSVTTGFPSGDGGRSWSWNPAAADPSSLSWTALPSSWLVPSQGILLVNNFGQSNLSAQITSAAPSSTTVGQVVHFAGVATGGSAPYSFNWNFGDGIARTDAGSVSGVDAPAHLYGASGTFQTILTITDNAGNVSAATVPVNVGGGTAATGGGGLFGGMNPSSWGSSTVYLVMGAAVAAGAGFLFLGGRGDSHGARRKSAL